MIEQGMLYSERGRRDCGEHEDLRVMRSLVVIAVGLLDRMMPEMNFSSSAVSRTCLPACQYVLVPYVLRYSIDSTHSETQWTHSPAGTIPVRGRSRS
jgi:hypothetical protein